MSSQVRRDIPAPPRPKLSELREQFGTIADELDAITQRLHDLESATPAPSPNPAPSSLDIPAYLRMVDGASEAAQPGDYTVGIALVALQPVTVKGVRLWWPHNGSATIRATLYSAPTDSAATLLRETTATVSADSLTDLSFTATAAITAGSRIIIGCWASNSKHANIQNASNWMPPKPAFIGAWASSENVRYAAGNAAPVNPGTSTQHATCWPLS